MIAMLFAMGEAARALTSADIEQLLSRMAQGDTRALETLYQHTKTSIYGFALSIVRHPQDAEDVMQDAYVRIFQAAAGYTSQGKPMAWVLTIVRNLSLMKLRERATVPLEDQPEPAQESFDGQTHDAMLLQAAMAILGEQEREIVMLHAVSGLKHREIAQLLSLPLSTVLSKYHRALSKLKIKVKEELS